MPRIGAANFQQRFRRGDDLDQPAVLKHERVAVAQWRRLGQDRAGIPVPRVPVIDDTAAMPIVVVEHDAIGRVAGSMSRPA